MKMIFAFEYRKRGDFTYPVLSDPTEIKKYLLKWILHEGVCVLPGSPKSSLAQYAKTGVRSIPVGPDFVTSALIAVPCVSTLWAAISRQEVRHRGRRLELSLTSALITVPGDK